ncbi:ankyrin repeat domain-containing protein [Massilia sp. TN1-12]|uniref:ankyrin repeat domain-containing protein n=1 Tax=Massilia paldalensis TaxID=3377675 RepID=UPI00384C9B32
MTAYTMTTYNHEDWFEAERLHRAGRDGDIQEIGRLILLGYDVNLFDDMGYTPLHHAVEGQQKEAVEILIKRGALINANDDATIGETPLSLAVQGRHLGIVLLLLECGADPDINGWMGFTARIRACRRVDETGKAMCEILAGYPPKFDSFY